MHCILPENIKEVRKAIVENGGYAGLRKKTAQERIKLFAKYVDTPGKTTTAEWLNREIERRIMVPGQTQAVKDWLKSLEKKKFKVGNKEALIDRILNKKDVFNPKGFYAEGLAKQALGFETSREDVKALFDKAKTVSQRQKRLLQIVPDYFKYTIKQANELKGDALDARIKLGEELVEFKHLYEDINIKAQLADYASKSRGGKAWDIALKIAGNIKSVKASVDISFLRQLWNGIYVDPKGTYRAWKAGVKTWANNAEYADAMLANLLTRPNALNGNYNKFGIEVGIKEEAFPESWISQLFDKGGKAGQWANVFRRSEDAFNVAIQTGRAEMFDWMWEKSNGDAKLLKDQDIGAAINTITGRGKVPFLRPLSDKESRIVNNLFFAPKWLASRIETLLDLRYIKHAGKMTPQGIRARAAIGNVIMLAIVQAIMAGATSDDMDEFIDNLFNFQSADFGKIVVGRTRFDLSTGTASLITLTSRLVTGETIKSSGAKAQIKPQDALWNFGKGKSAPAVQLVSKMVHFIRSGGEWVDYWGKPVHFTENPDEAVKEITELVAPISISGLVQFALDTDEGQSSTETCAEAVGVLADIIGVGSNTYDKK